MCTDPGLHCLIEEAERVVNLSQLKECNAHRVTKEGLLELLNLCLFFSLLVLVILGYEPVETYQKIN